MAGCGGDTEQAQTNTDVDTKTILQAQVPEEGEEIAVITTSEGVVKMRFFPEEAPKAVENFKTLAKDGYYDGLTFHRVINDFMVQTGDPTATGRGGESCWGEDFETEVSEKLHFYRGAVAMANAGPDTNGSQFFIVQQKTVMEDALKAIEDAIGNNEEEVGITLTDGNFYTLSQLYPEEVMNYYREQGGSAHLEYVFGNGYSIFGQVFEGMEAVDAIAAAETDEADKPVEDVIIESITFETYAAQ
ncbi:MAG: peptidylprolyl isomerase [Anaerotignum sp.]|nr:peptidylprolyl isomerase [Anaerotignum sp.]MBR4113148.1 peptidylprolyl isomerase [Anaerotignum sp.]